MDLLFRVRVGCDSLCPSSPNIGHNEHNEYTKGTTYTFIINLILSFMYYLVYGCFYLLSLLPMRILYMLSDLVYLIVYRLLGYRKKVVFENLQIAFPKKTEKELEEIAGKFYHNLLDSFIETIKLVSAGKRFLEKRVTVNHEVLKPLYESGKSCQMHLGHTFNWEWGQLALTPLTDYKIMVVYMPITNRVFEKLMYKLRTRNGNIFISARNMSESMASYKESQYLLGLVADQSPGRLDNAYWTNFFNRPTAFVSGPEKGAKEGNLPVVFASIIKPKRGYYHATLTIATEDPSSLKKGALTNMYARFMEETIREHPEMWLWSHRRWKHTYDLKYKDNWIGEKSEMVLEQ
jgi:Kdo2-lipid IVA lauroyltransferase/acyltransferase